jgi:hypothetical protein
MALTPVGNSKRKTKVIKLRVGVEHIIVKEGWLMGNAVRLTEMVRAAG